MGINKAGGSDRQSLSNASSKLTKMVNGRAFETGTNWENMSMSKLSSVSQSPSMMTSSRIW